MTAIQTLNIELRKIQEAQALCVEDSGLVRSQYRERYNILTKKASELKGSIDWLEAMYADKENNNAVKS